MIHIDICSIVIPIIVITLITFIRRIYKKEHCSSNRLKEINERIGKGRYNRTAEMSLDMVIHLYRINPKRLKFIYLESYSYSYNSTLYKHLLYNGNQEDKINTKKYVVTQDSTGKITYNEIVYPWLFYQSPDVLMKQTVTRTVVEKKAEDNWTPETTVNIILSDKDYNKLLSLIQQEEERKKQAKKLADTQFVLESAQKDLDKMKEQVNAEINAANTMMQEVVENVRAYQQAQ